MSEAHVLVVDDDPQITSFLKRYLEKQSFSVSCAASASEMDTILQSQTIDLCILDIGLPGKDGFEITRDVRAHSNLPIIVLSARDDPFDRVIGLELGADDYVSKPFEARELLARVKSVLRRYKIEALAVRQQETGAPLLQFGDWVMNLQERTLRSLAKQTDVPLTTTEFELLHALIQHPHSVLSRNQLLDIARGRDCYVGDRTVDVHIMRLRKKIEPNPSEPIYVKTIHGIGYCFVANVTKASQPALAAGALPGTPEEASYRF